jgi:hypothetical protein
MEDVMKCARRASHACLATGLLVAFVLASSAPSLRAQVDPSLGTWKMNLAKSKYSPGPPPMSETQTYEAFGAGGVKCTIDRMDAAGNDRLSLLMHDIVSRVPALSFIDARDVLVFARGGRSTADGAYARCHCLRLPPSEPGYYFWRDSATSEIIRRSEWFVTKSPYGDDGRAVGQVPHPSQESDIAC